MELDKCLEGLTIVLSGMFESISRDKLEEFMREKGARVTGSVSGKTDMLVIGYKLEDGRNVQQGSKYNKAMKLKTKILNEE